MKAYPGEGCDVEMIGEHDRVVLTAPVPNEDLEIGAVGTVVHVCSDGGAFEVEFMTLEGHTATVATVDASLVQPATDNEAQVGER